MFLVDSGGQYVTGTTDVTRTMHMGTPLQEQAEDYTMVLKAHIHLASLVSSIATTFSLKKITGLCISVFTERNAFNICLVCFIVRLLMITFDLLSYYHGEDSF